MSTILMFVGAVAAVSVVLSLYYLVRTTAQTTPEVHRHWTTALGTWNAVMFPDRLTPRGRVFRRRFYLPVIACIISFVALRFF